MPSNLQTSGYTSGDWLDPGSQLGLSCAVKPGIEDTYVKWTKNGEVVDDSQVAMLDVLTNTYDMDVADADHGATVKCVVTGGSLTVPMESEAFILQVKSKHDWYTICRLADKTTRGYLNRHFMQRFWGIIFSIPPIIHMRSQRWRPNICCIPNVSSSWLYRMANVRT